MDLAPPKTADSKDYKRRTFRTKEFVEFKDLFSSGAHYPPTDTIPTTCEACTKQHKPFDLKGHADCRAGAEVAHRMYFRDHDKPLINVGKCSCGKCNITSHLLFFRTIVGIEKRNPISIQQKHAMRSRSPTLRKTETQDVYRTFVEQSENYVAGAPIIS